MAVCAYCETKQIQRYNQSLFEEPKQTNKTREKKILFENTGGSQARELQCFVALFEMVSLG